MSAPANEAHAFFAPPRQSKTETPSLGVLGKGTAIDRTTVLHPKPSAVEMATAVTGLASLDPKPIQTGNGNVRLGEQSEFEARYATKPSTYVSDLRAALRQRADDTPSLGVLGKGTVIDDFTVVGKPHLDPCVCIGASGGSKPVLLGTTHPACEPYPYSPNSVGACQVLPDSYNTPYTGPTLVNPPPKPPVLRSDDRRIENLNILWQWLRRQMDAEFAYAMKDAR